MKKALRQWLVFFGVTLIFLAPFLVFGLVKISDTCTRFNDFMDGGCHKTPDVPGAAPSGAVNAAGNQAFCPTCGPSIAGPDAADSNIGDIGMPRWWVDEPYINLHLTDKPLSYTTSAGKEMAFRFNYKQRYAVPGLDQIPSIIIPALAYPNPNRLADDPYINTMHGYYSGSLNSGGMTNAAWSHNWMSHIVFWDWNWEAYSVGFGGTSETHPYQFYYEALLFDTDGSAHYFAPNSSPMDGETLAPGVQTNDPISQVGLAAMSYTNIAAPDGNGIYWGSATNGFKLTYPDGSQDIFGLLTLPGGGYTTRDALLTERIDPQGRTTLLGYQAIPATNAFNQSNVVFRVRYVVDTDNRTNTFVYGSSVIQPWLLQEIDDPFGRKIALAYNGNNWLSTITDAGNNTNSFVYTNTPSGGGWLNSLTTPYGTTSFSYYQVMDPTYATNYQQRVILVNEPDSAHQLFAYVHSNATVSASLTSPTVSGVVFDNGTTGGQDEALYFRDSFHWDRKQFANLTGSVANAGQIGNLTSADYQKASLQHWLLGTDGVSVTETLSSACDPSLDPGGATAGQRRWLGYGAGTTNADTELQSQVSALAQLLPDGTTQYTHYYYYSAITYPNQLLGYVSRTEQTFNTSGGGVGVLTNWFIYNTSARNYIDLKSASNSIGQYVNMGYNSSHQATSITNALNQVTTLTYAYGGNLAAVTNYSGQVIVLTYNPYYSGTNTAYFLESVTNLPEGLLTTISDYTNGLPRVVEISGTGLNSLTVSNTWDNLNRLTGTLYPDNTTESNVYSILDLAAHTDRLTNTTHFVHDALQHLIYITNALNKVTALTWCSCGSLTSIVDPLNNTNKFNYNNQSLLTNVVLADGSSFTNQFDLLGRLTNRVDGAGHAVSFTYNNQSLLTAASNAYGQLLGLGYDAVGNPISVTNADGLVFARTYDVLNRVITNAWPDGNRELFQYSTNGLIAYTNQDGEVTRFYRDGSGRITNEVNNLLQTNQFAFDALNHPTSLIDGLGHSTTWQYNQYGWLTNKLNNLSASVQTNGFDANGRLTTRWMPATGTTTYKWDALGNLTNVVYPTRTNNYSYNADNRLTNMADTNGSDSLISSFTYTGTGQLASETAPWTSDTITYSYSQGQRTSLNLTQPTGSWSNNYGYDSAWRLTSLTSPAGLFKNTYASSASRLVRLIALPNSASVTNYYDSLARLDYTALLNYWGHPLDGYSYQNDAWGLRTNITRQLGLTTNSVTAGYDGIGELASWTGQESGGTLRQNEQLAYGFDAANNLQYRTNGLLMQTFTDNSLNEISTVTRSGLFTETGAIPAPATNITVNGVAALRYGDFTFASTNNTLANGSNTFTTIAQNAYGFKVTNILSLNLLTPVSFQYDANGNLTNDGARVFSYDAENQLTNVFATNLWRVAFVYDGMNRRRIKREYNWQSSAWVLTNETHYIDDGMQVLQERDTNNNPIVTYTRGVDMSQTLSGAGGIGGLLARTDANGSTFYHADGNGNITAMMDGNENIVARYEFDGFGRLINKTGSMSSSNHMMFSSMEFISNPGIYGYTRRFYDPTLPRFLNADPAGESGGINLYSAMGNNPVSMVDPYGLAPGDWWDARTYINGGFTEGWTDAASSIGRSAGGSLALAFDGLDDDAWHLIGANRSLMQGEMAFIAGAQDVSDSAYGAMTGFDPTGLLPIDPDDPNMEDAAILGMAVSMLDGGGEGKLGLSKCKNALEKVHEEVGSLPKGKPGKFGSPQRGTPLKGYRLDPPHPKALPGSPESKPHINWWDYTGGKKGKGGRYGAVPIE